ncbi:MAG: amidohydrolase family protein [Chloroflexi bacterium]|nr:amidohydrolase family protein [Chloroflexota bacterium]
MHIFEENALGSIEAGKHADFVVIEHDLLTMAPEEAKAIRPVMTVAGGKIVSG